ncbi:unnamed protein product, partial [Ilex paraguariensis]
VTRPKLGSVPQHPNTHPMTPNGLETPDTSSTRASKPWQYWGVVMVFFENPVDLAPFKPSVLPLFHPYAAQSYLVKE